MGIIGRKRTELWVGIFLILGFIMIALVAINLGNLTSNSKDAYHINVVFRNAAGIIKGSEVRLGGAKIGRVSSTPMLTESGDAVKLVLELQKGVQLQKGSVVQAATLNLLGDKYIEISPPAKSTNSYIAPDETVYGDSGDDLETIKANVATISQQSIVLLRRVESAMVDMQGAAKGFTETASRINAGILSDANRKNIDTIMENLAETSVNLAAASKGLPGTLENVKETTTSIRETTNEFRNIVSKVDKKLDDLDPAIKAVAPMMISLKKSSESLDRSLTAINRQEGVLGTIIYDKKMKDYVQDFVSRMRAQGILRYKNPKAEDAIDLRDKARMQGNRN